MRRMVTAWAAALLMTLCASSAGTIQTPVADAFDFPVGKPDAEGYYLARGYRPNGHLGEDWNGRGGGNSDLGDPVYAIGNGVVVLAMDYKLGWGNVVIIRHAYYDAGALRFVDSLYGHLEKFSVARGQTVKRGQEIGSIGNHGGMYRAHLHFELRKNVEIGMQRSSFARDFSNYYSPSEFIRKHRVIKGGGAAVVAVATDTFAFPQVPGKARTGVARQSTPRDPKLRQRISAKRDSFKVERYGDMVD